MKDLKSTPIPSGGMKGNPNTLFRQKELAMGLSKAISRIASELEDDVKIMNFCGTHEWTITHFGLRTLMPKNIELVAGPGCPVCITPGYYVDTAIRLALDGVRVFAYGDTYRLPGRPRSDGPKTLEEAKSRGADIRIVYSVRDAIRIAKADGRDSVFLAVGFETTAPATLSPLVNGSVPENLTFINVHRLTPPIMRYVLDNYPESPIRGVIAPGHVSTITGASAWEFVPKEYGIPIIVTGFEPIDVLIAILEILKQLKEGKPSLVNEYRRAVSWEGNRKAHKMIEETCEIVDSGWRGIGFVPKSGLRFKGKFRRFDSFEIYGIQELTKELWREDLSPGCRCAEITLGIAKPTDCPMFMKGCTPESPYGPCMVSSEGTCSIWARYGGGVMLEEIAEDLGLS